MARLEKYYEIVKHYIQQKDLSQNEKSIELWANNIKNTNPNLNEMGLFNMFKINCQAIKLQLKELYETKIFHIDNNLGIALEMTNNTFYNRHLPFDNMFFEYNLKVNKLNIFAFHIFKDKWGTNIRCYFKDSKSIRRQDVKFFDAWYESEIEKAKLLNKQKEIAKKAGVSQPIKDKEEKIIKSFFCNFIDFLNTPDVEVVTVDITKEQNEKRILQGKLPVPPQKFIRITGKLKIYLLELNSGEHFNYSHKFWVRGHFRTLRSEKWKNARGIKIWILPFIKGKGILVNKIYEVKK